MTKDLRSYRFRKEREANWFDLERLVEAFEKGRSSDLSFEELNRLPHLYRATLSGLSVARSISLDKGLINYLESLSARAYIAVYGNRLTFPRALSRLTRRQIPQAVRSSLMPIILATIFMFAGAIAGYFIVFAEPDLYFAIMPDHLSGGRTPYADPAILRETIYSEDGQPTSSMVAFASSLFTHNAMIGIFSFALGFAAIAPTALLLFYNGLILGAMVRVFAMHGLGYDFIAWLSIHGTTEIFALIICGAGGVILGNAIIFPGRYNRIDNLAIAGKRAGLLIIAAVVMLFCAGLIEGIARQTVQSAELRLLIGFLFLGLWSFYFAAVGRKW